METKTMQTEWYEASTGNHQGLIVETKTERNIAVTYDKNDTAFIVTACNAHEELIQACSLGLELEGLSPFMQKTFKEALAKAGVKV